MYLDICMKLQYPGFAINLDISDVYSTIQSTIQHYEPQLIDPNRNYWGEFDRATARRILAKLITDARVATRINMITSKMRLIVSDFNISGSLAPYKPLTITMTKRKYHGITCLSA